MIAKSVIPIGFGALAAAASISVFAASGLAGCGAPQQSASNPTNESSGADQGPRRGGMGVASEIGALDEGKVKKTFERASQKLMACYGSGTQRVPYLAGDISFKLRVKRDGGVRWVHVKDSTLGDRATEECMMRALKALTWPTPVDGENGIAESSFSFAPGGDERPPLDWSPDQLGDPYREVKPKLLQCRSAAGAGPLKATLYVETDGKPGAIGLSSADEKGEAAAQCVVDTLSGVTFPSPGSFASKVSVVID